MAEPGRAASVVKARLNGWRDKRETKMLKYSLLAGGALALMLTAALLMLLAERHPERGFAPAVGTTDRALYLQWMIILANTLMPAFRLYFYADEGAGPDNVEATKAQAVLRIEKVFARIDGLLADGRPYLLGEHIGAADFLLGMLCRWSRNMTRTTLDWPHLKAYVERLRAMPSYRETHARENLQGWI